MTNITNSDYEVEQEFNNELERRNGRKEAFLFDCFVGGAYRKLLARPCSMPIGRHGMEYTGNWCVYCWDTHLTWYFSPYTDVVKR